MGKTSWTHGSSFVLFFSRLLTLLHILPICVDTDSVTRKPDLRPVSRIRRQKTRILYQKPGSATFKRVCAYSRKR